MPALLKRTEKTAPDAVFVAVTSFVTSVDGREIPVREGQRLRGDHAAVRKVPHLFIADGSDDVELIRQREQVIYKPQGDAIARVERAQREERARRERVIPVERQVRVAQTFQLGTFGRQYTEGTIVDREDPTIAKVALEHPEWFATIGRLLHQVESPA